MGEVEARHERKYLSLKIKFYFQIDLQNELTIKLHLLEQNSRYCKRFFTSSTRGGYFLSLTGKVFLEFNWEGIS